MRRNTGKGLTSAQCLAAFCLMAAQAEGFDRSAWLQDYSTLKQTLEKSYSNLAWFGSPEGKVDLPALDRRTLAALKSVRSDEDARSALLNFVRSFHDGHFSQLATLAPAAGVKIARPGEPDYSRRDAVGGCAALGYAPDGQASFSLPVESLPGFRMVSDGLAQPLRAGILQDGETAARLGVVRIPSFETSFPTLCVEAWGQDDVWNQQGKLIRAALRRTVTQRWYEALAGLLRGFRSEGVSTVLVDIGDNSGGDDSGEIEARLFTAIPLHSAPLWMSQDQTASAPYFDEQLGALHRASEFAPADQALVAQSLATFTSQKEKLGQSVCSLGWVWRERRAWNAEGCRRLVQAGSAGGPLADLAPNAVADVRVARLLHWPAVVMPLWGTWTGPLYVLTNGRTYSSAEMFAAVLRNNRAARTIGSQTGGDGCGFMTSPSPVVLPHSRLRFRLPNCVRLRADGTDEVAGVKPDLPVLPVEGENTRARALRLVEEVFADLKRK